jgi:hypothetical protein
MTCDQFADRLADYLEGDMDATARAAIETHASSCAECRALLADLRTLQAEATKLPELSPKRDLWAGIAARIETPVVELKNGGTVERWNGGTSVSGHLEERGDAGSADRDGSANCLATE